MSGLQIAINRACNACLLGDRRLTNWEREFLQSLMDRRIVDRPEKLSEKQAEVIHRIAAKVQDVLPL